MSLQGIMHRFGDLVEERVSQDHFPVGFQAQLIEEGDGPVQDLRHPAPGAGGVNVNELSVGHWLRQALKLSDHLRTYNGRIIIEADHRRPPDIDESGPEEYCGFP